VVLSRAELSFVLPLSAMEYIFGAVIAYYMLGEKITWMRFSGTFVICIGIALICLDQIQRDSAAMR
jgi:drug/metabolite transporter (DMT)-like permease